MKIKDLAALAGRFHSMDLLNTVAEDGTTVRQHLCLGGSVLLPLDGLQTITLDTLMVLADIPEKERADYKARQGELTGLPQLMAADCMPGDEDAVKLDISIKSVMFDLACFEGQETGEILFLPAALLKVVKGAEQPGFVIRNVEDFGSVLVAQDGWKNIGAFTPAVRWAEQPVTDELAKITRAAKRLQLEKAEREQDSQ